MSTPKGYTSKADIEAYIMQDIAASFDTQINNWISSVEKYIESFTERIFIADSAASIRLYNGNDRGELSIDDCVAITKVEVGNDSCGESFTEVLASGSNRYFALPNNYLALGLPINKLKLCAGVWGAGIQNQRITAKWGYSIAAPEDIKWAAMVLAAGICIPGITGNIGGESAEKIDGYSVSYDNGGQRADHEKAIEILKSYQRINI